MKLKTIILPLAISLAGCDQPQNSGQAPSSQSPQAKVAPAQSKMPEFLTYGEDGAANTWPPILNTEKSVADDLLAKNYYVVVDGSGSMGDRECSENRTKMSVAKSAVIEFIGKLPKTANLGLYAFDASGQRERLPLTKNDLDKASYAIKKIRAGGGTPLSTSVEAGINALTKQAISQLGYGEYHLVIVTDGIASVGYKPDIAMDTLLTSTPIVVHTIGFCIDSKHSLNRPGYTLYKGANNAGALMAGLESVLAESPQFDVDSFQGVQ